MTDDNPGGSIGRRVLVLVAVFTLAASVTFSGVAAAQSNTSNSSSMCDSELVNNVLEPLLTAAFQIGPLIGALSGIVSLIMMSQVTSKDKKKKWKERRNDAFLYGVVGVLASGWIIEFFTTSVMNMPSSCINTTFLMNTLVALL